MISEKELKGIIDTLSAEKNAYQDIINGLDNNFFAKDVEMPKMSDVVEGKLRGMKNRFTERIDKVQKKLDVLWDIYNPQ